MINNEGNMISIYNLYGYKNWQIFSVITLITLIITFIIQLRLLNIDVFSHLMGTQLSSQQITELYETQLKYQWLPYLL